MSSDGEDVLAAINLVNYLNYNQGSTVRKYWSIRFGVKIAIPVACAPYLKSWTIPIVLKVFIDFFL
jgi:hypothetical protein